MGRGAAYLELWESDRLDFFFSVFFGSIGGGMQKSVEQLDLIMENWTHISQTWCRFLVSGVFGGPGVCW